jgi:radical SAM protein with 4Fe4S-binding SPASM domain
MAPSEYINRKTIGELDFVKKPDMRLTHLDLEITERCNNNCVHCYINQPADSMPHVDKELSAEEIQNILSEAAGLGCLTVRITGGEPLLRKDFIDIYVHAKKLGLGVVIFTNATLIDETLIEVLKKMPAREKIEITLYGMKKSSCERVTRTKGSYESAIRGIELLLSNHIPFIIKGAYLPQNKDDKKLLDTWCAQMPTMKNRSPSYAVNFDLRARRDDLSKNKQIEKLRSDTEKSLEFFMEDTESFLRETVSFIKMFSDVPGEKIFNCGACKNSLTIDPYGKIYPCLLLRHPLTTYDLKEGSLDDALRNFLPDLLNMKATNKSYLERCAKCFLKSLCGQCPARSWMEHGSLDTPVEYHCKVAHEKAYRVGILLRHEKAWETQDWKKRVQNL